jgi:catechol 2,3-dioxygenase-like lactoylglutathione lyase family enzyme
VTHHVGIVLASIDAEVSSYETTLNLRVVSGPFIDPLQEARVIFLSGGQPAEAAIELVEPTSETSPVASFLKRGGGMHHICYLTKNLEGELARVRALGALIVRPPVPAVAFQGRRIAWIYTRQRLLVELLEE